MMQAVRNPSIMKMFGIIKKKTFPERVTQMLRSDHEFLSFPSWSAFPSWPSAATGGLSLRMAIEEAQGLSLKLKQEVHIVELPVDRVKSPQALQPFAPVSDSCGLARCSFGLYFWRGTEVEYLQLPYRLPKLWTAVS